MFDIIKCEANPSDFKKFYFYGEVKEKIKTVENLSEASKINKKMLVMLKSYALDEGAMKVIKERGKICFLIDLSKIINSSGIRRGIEIGRIGNFLKLCIRQGVYYSFATFSEKESDLRTPFELMNIACLFGINQGQASFSLEMIKHYLEGHSQ